MKERLYTCPRCRNKVRSDAKYCTVCGLPVKQPASGARAVAWLTLGGLIPALILCAVAFIIVISIAIYVVITGGHKVNGPDVSFDNTKFRVKTGLEDFYNVNEDGEKYARRKIYLDKKRTTENELVYKIELGHYLLWKRSRNIHFREIDDYITITYVKGNYSKENRDALKKELFDKFEKIAIEQNGSLKVDDSKNKNDAFVYTFILDYDGGKTTWKCFPGDDGYYLFTAYDYEHHAASLYLDSITNSFQW